MNVIIWIGVSSVLAILAGIAAWYYGRSRRKKESRLVSLVALLREPMTIDPAILATLAGRALHADLGDGITAGEDGCVCCVGVINFITFRDEPILVNCFAHPYVEDPESRADQIIDLRIRCPFAEHRAWISFDALNADASTPAAEIAEHYRQLGRLLAEFIDERCLLIVRADTGQAYTITDGTDAALRSDDPLAALDALVDSPVIAVYDEDELELTVATAKQSWPQFVAAFEGRVGENYSVKTPLTYEDHTEYIWVSVTAIEGDRVYGRLANEPAALGPWKLNSKLSVPIDDVQDWCYVDRDGNLVGGFSVDLVRQAAKRQVEAQTQGAPRS